MNKATQRGQHGAGPAQVFFVAIGAAELREYFARPTSPGEARARFGRRDRGASREYFRRDEQFGSRGFVAQSCSLPARAQDRALSRRGKHCRWFGRAGRWRPLAGHGSCMPSTRVRATKNDRRGAFPREGGCGREGVSRWRHFSRERAKNAARLPGLRRRRVDRRRPPTVKHRGAPRSRVRPRRRSTSHAPLRHAVTAGARLVASLARARPCKPLRNHPPKSRVRINSCNKIFVFGMASLRPASASTHKEH